MKIFAKTALALTTIFVGSVSCNMDIESQGQKGEKYELYAPYVSHVISVSDMQDSSADGRALIDLGSPEYGYWMEPGVDPTRVDVRCPSMSAAVSLELWTSELGVSPTQWDDGLFIFTLGEDQGQVQKNDCPLPCTGQYDPGSGWHCVC